MRVAVVGASGNVGTAVLTAFAAAPEVTSLVAVARRLPDVTAEPYAAAEWVTHDVGAKALDAADEERLVDELAHALAGADVVVHLAWLIQPNHERDLLRRTNVDGTARVARAAVRAGVQHLVCASSVGAYSPVDDDVPRDESWPTEGIRSSHYSVDKAAQERVLDELEATHPEILVSRLRPALIFTADAGAEIGRYFLGPWVPRAALRPGRLPVLPLPRGLRLQVVHADDIAQAYLRVVIQRAGGAFNVATDPVLWPADLARALDHGRYLEVAPRLVRPLLHSAWRAHLLAADPGWLDLGLGVPLMDSTRIRRLGWLPTHDAESTLREMLDGLAERSGRESVPMRPDDRRFEGTPEAAELDVAEPGGAGLGTDAARSAGAAEVDLDLLGLYLSDHLSGATAGAGRAGRMAKATAGSALGPGLADLAGQITTERAFLADLIDRLGLRRRPYRQALAAAGERVGRLKLNGRVLSTSPMTVVLELELMRSAVMGKLGLWQTLAEMAPDLGLDSERFVALADGARDQLSMLDTLHERARRTAFRGGTGLE